MHADERDESGQSINGEFFPQIFSVSEYAYNKNLPGWSLQCGSRTSWLTDRMPTIPPGMYPAHLFSVSFLQVYSNPFFLETESALFMASDE